jgi:hypothetical protein
MSFRAFPDFSSLTLKDREEYESLTREYPPIADLSFPFLMGWWGLQMPVGVSLLEENLVVSYCTKEKIKTPELSLIGTNKIDESICTILDYLREKGEVAKLVHVPEFVIEDMRFPELFNFKAERNYDEYIIALSKFYPLEDSSRHHRKRVMNFAERLLGTNVSVGPVDLSLSENQELLLGAMREWPKKGINSLASSNNGAMENAIRHADELGFKSVCLKLDGTLHCFMLFYAPQHSEYISLEYIQMSYAMPNLLNFSINMFAEWFAEQGVRYANLGMDFGKPILRVAKVALQPVNFFRKYTIEPALSREAARRMR